MLERAPRIPVDPSLKIFAEIWVYAPSSMHAERLLHLRCVGPGLHMDLHATSSKGPAEHRMNIQQLLLNIQKP